MRGILGTSMNVGIMLSIFGIAPGAAGVACAGSLEAGLVRLPEPAVAGNVPVENVLLKRRSVRSFSGQPLTLAEASQLLWAAQGVTDPAGKRTAPSAGALYPLEIYLIVGEVTGLDRGVYRYQPQKQALRRISDADRHTALATAALEQSWIGEAAAAIVMAAVYRRTTGKYGQRGIRYVHMEAGHAAQSVALQALALNFGTVFVGAFDDDEVKRVVGMPGDEQPLCILPIGRIRQAGP